MRNFTRGPCVCAPVLLTAQSPRGGPRPADAVQGAPRDRDRDHAQEPREPAPSALGTGPSSRPRRRAPRAGPRRRKMAPIFYVSASICLLIQPGPATAAPLSGQPAALQDLRHGRTKLSCEPGFHLSQDGKRCLPCEAGVDYTKYSNSLPSCLLCSVCEGDQVQKAACTTTSDAVCECKNGTFRTPEAPEFCQRCRARCPDGEVEEIPCTPQHDRQCVHMATGEAGAPTQPVPTTWETPASHHFTSIWKTFITATFVIEILVFLLLAIVVAMFWKQIKQKNLDMKRICPGIMSLLRKCSTGGCEAQYTHPNGTVTLRPLPSAGPVEQETGEHQVTQADAQSSGEAECLLEGASKERLSVPVHGEDPTESSSTTVRCDSSNLP